MRKKRMPKSFRKHIRLEKARIRRENLGLAKQKELIDQLYQKISNLKTNFKKNKNENKRNLQPSNK
jgi:hypothetical protein